MSEWLKVSGKKQTLPQQPASQWKFQSRPGGWWIAESHDGQRKRFMLFQKSGRLSLSLNGLIWSAELLQDRVEGADSQQTGDAALIAQFPGKVRKVSVSIGMEVLEGDPLLLIEAMKMEFAIRAPYAGKITHLHIKEGQQISPGDRFLELEAQLDEKG